MTNPDGGTVRSGGRGVLSHDSKVGNLVNAVVTAGGLAVVSWLGDLDFSTAPKAIATLAPPVIGLVVGLITSKVLPRYAEKTRPNGL